MTPTTPIFFHCQTDGLEGPPIEIAWALVAPDELGVVSEAHLICPPPEWAGEIKPGAASALSRGITLADLRDFGTTPLKIAMRFNRILKDRELFPVHPTDEAAVKRIFEAARIEPRFELRKTDAEVLIGELARLRRVTNRTMARVKRKVELLSPLDAHPEVKARYLAILWAEIARPTLSPTREPPATLPNHRKPTAVASATLGLARSTISGD
jgi:hypothetical protein